MSDHLEDLLADASATLACLRAALEAAAAELMNQQDAWDEMLEHATTEGRKTACLQNGCAAYGTRQRIRALLDGRGGRLMSEEAERLQAIRDRLAAAPAGPWEVVGNTVYFAPKWWVAFPGAISLAEFIAHSRADLEFLLTVLEGSLDDEALRKMWQRSNVELSPATVEALKRVCPPIDAPPRRETDQEPPCPD
jgi:hypothetical protein